MTASLLSHLPNKTHLTKFEGRCFFFSFTHTHTHEDTLSAIIFF